jgi:hypothetical protein
MPEESSHPEQEALIQELLARYEKQLRRALKQRPRTLEQLEDTAEEVGNQVKRDITEQGIKQEGTAEQGPKTACCCGRQARYVADYTRRWVSRHGVFFIERAYYHCRGCGKGFCPLDRRLGLLAGEYSPAVVALSARFAGYLPPRAAARELGEVCGIVLSANTVRQHAHRMGVALQKEWEQEEAAFFACPDKPAPARAVQLQMTLDGVMVHVDGAWHEAKLGCAYTRGRLGGIQSARYTATLSPAAPFGKRLRVLGHLCGADNCGLVALVADGADWIWIEVGKYFPTKTQILDFYHACEHLWELARVGCGQEQEAAAWVEGQQQRLLCDQVADVLREVGSAQPQTEEQRQTQARVLGYLCTHAHRMRYQTFSQQGYHIGSGVAEAGCKAVVQARLKGAGMRWKRAGAEAMLHLRCAVCSTERPDFRRLARLSLAA